MMRWGIVLPGYRPQDCKTDSEPVGYHCNCGYEVYRVQIQGECVFACEQHGEIDKDDICEDEDEALSESLDE